MEDLWMFTAIWQTESEANFKVSGQERGSPKEQEYQGHGRKPMFPVARLTKKYTSVVYLAKSSRLSHGHHNNYHNQPAPSSQPDGIDKDRKSVV